MASESRSRKKEKKTASYSSKRKSSPLPGIIAGAVAVLALGVGGFFWWQGNQAAGNFDALMAEGKRPDASGKPAFEAATKTNPDAGRGHTALGSAISYATDPPTSGVHWPNWVEPGVYTDPQRNERLVHALEHGNVVVYYDTPDPAVLNQLKAWAGRFRGQWDGMVLTFKPGLGSTIELTAWDKVMRLETWQPALAAAFIDQFRGRGPENPVR